MPHRIATPLHRVVGLLVAGTTFVACGGSDGDTATATTVDSARATECSELLQKVEPSVIGDEDELAAHACRQEGYDPLWNAIGIYVTDEDYETWRLSGDLPTCDDIVGRDNPLGGQYRDRDARQCAALMSGEQVEDVKGEFGTPISDAAAECGVEDVVRDEGDSITLDTKGADDFSGHDIADVACVLTELDTPDYVVSRIDSTRALDGTVDASWDGYEAFWNYHPDSGMNLTIYHP